MKTILTDINKLPYGADRIARNHRLQDDNNDVVTSEDGKVIFKRLSSDEEEQRVIPAIVIVGKKAHLITDQPVKWLDVGDVLGKDGEYQRIVILARNFKDRSEEVCKAINIIHDFVVLPLAVSNYKAGAPKDFLARRGIIFNAKFKAVQIWKESKK